MNQLGDGGKRIGELLVERGWVTGEQVLRAILSQRSQGGRLGTCLLELDLVSEERLLETLALQQGAPAAPLDSLRYIPDEVVGLISPRVAERCRAVPIAATDREVEVALLDARNMALLDELAFCTSRRVRARVANEARIYDALARHYGVECPRRFRELVDRLNRTRYLWKKEAAVPADSPDDVRWQAPEEALGGPLPAPVGARETGAARTPDPPTDPPQPPGEAVVPDTLKPPAPASSVKPLRIEDVDLLLQHTRDARAVGEILLRFARQSFERCALFNVRDGALAAWLAEGPGLDDDVFRALRVNLREPSVFLNLARGAELHLGPLPPMPVHRQAVRCWGPPWPGECLILPIRIGPRLVGALYADRGAEKLGGLDATTWKRLAVIAGMALELCILKKKVEAN